PEDPGVAADSVDLFNGALNVDAADLSFPGNAGHDLVVRRWYSSKLRVQDEKGKKTYGPEPSSYGVGWQMHQGRLYIGAADDNPPPLPVLEVPGARAQVFHPSKLSGPPVSQDFWILTTENVGGTEWKTAIDPSGTKYRFRNASGDRRNPGERFLYVSSITTA